MQRVREILGWSVGQDPRRFNDETGVWHLVIVRGGELHHMTSLACGAKAQTSGQVHKSPTSHGYRCRNCVRALMAVRS